MPIQMSTLPMAGGELPLTSARVNGTGAAVVIVPSAFGVAPDLVAQMEELAEDASQVVTFDPFFRADPGPLPYHDMAGVMSRLRALDAQRLESDFRALLDRVRADGPVVALGICFGGPFALRAAADGLVDGVVTWHGTRLEDHLARAADIQCPMRLHFGGADPFVPMSAVAAIQAAFAGRREVEVHVHAGATHGFSHRGAPQAYDAGAERAGMASVRALVGGVSRG